MRLHSLTARRSAFTLIELLVVITIIGVLAAIAFPVTTAVLDKARKLKTRAVIKDLQVAIKAYQTEYNRYPNPSDSSGSDTNVDTSDTKFVSALLGDSNNPSGINSREIQFIDLPIAKNNLGGLIGTPGNYKLVDDFKDKNSGEGSPYIIILDTNYDNRVANPDVGNSDPNVSGGTTPLLPAGVAVYSKGKDSQAQTKDDLVSWRS